MHRIYITPSKSLLASEKDALAIADIIERKTGHRPQVTEARTEENKKPDIYFCRLTPKYGE